MAIAEPDAKVEPDDDKRDPEPAIIRVGDADDANRTCCYSLDWYAWSTDRLSHGLGCPAWTSDGIDPSDVRPVTREFDSIVDEEFRGHPLVGPSRVPSHLARQAWKRALNRVEESTPPSIMNMGRQVYRDLWE